MTSTTQETVSQQYRAITSSDDTVAITIQNQTDSSIEVVISDQAVTDSSRGLLIDVGDERLYSGFTGTVYVRCRGNREQKIGVMTS